jgi:hypothetical protein
MSLSLKRKANEVEEPFAMLYESNIPSEPKKMKIEDGFNPFCFPSSTDLQHIPKEYVKYKFFMNCETIPRNPRGYGLTKANPPTNEALLRYSFLPLS